MHIGRIGIRRWRRLLGRLIMLLTLGMPCTGGRLNGAPLRSRRATTSRQKAGLGKVGPLMEQPGYSMLAREKVDGEFNHMYEEIGTGLTIFSPPQDGFPDRKVQRWPPHKLALQPRR